MVVTQSNIFKVFIGTSQHTHSYCTQRFRVNHNRHLLDLKRLFLVCRSLERYGFEIGQQAFKEMQNVRTILTVNVGLTGGKCFLNVNKDLLNSKASQTLACVAGTGWFILVSMVIRWLTFYVILKEISENDCQFERSF